MIEVIDRILARLADRVREFAGEQEFQIAMANALIAEGIPDCYRELGFQSFRFINRGSLKLDILANRFGIELKYVRNGPSGRPADGQAFPYDVILDCARIETIIGDALDCRCRRSVADGVAIGLTNDARQWDPVTVPDWWSRNFRLPDVVQDNQTWAPLPRQLFEVTTTTRRRDIRGGIFVNERYHVRLDHLWEYRWKGFPAQWNGGNFRYVIVRRRGDAGGGHGPRGYDPMTTVPFAGETNTLAALKHRLDMVRALHEERPRAATRRLFATLPRDIEALERQLSYHSWPTAAE